MELYPGFRSQPLVCHMISVSLDQAPQFEALSYTWGQSFERFTLYQEPKESNGLRTSKSILKITRGLYEALMQLRTPSGSRMLWVDAICIDQENWKERGEQVRIMRQIYTRAAHVLVWLGLEDEQTPAALQAVAKLKTHITSRGLSFATLKSMKDEDPYADMLGLSKDLLDTESAASLRQLYRRPWFERMWIVQEVTAGASSSEVHIGPHAIPWDDL